MVKKLILTIAFVFALGMASLVTALPVGADGNGSPDACKNGPSVEGNEDELSFNAGSGNIVNGVCIKSGSNMFGGNQHSGVLGNGTYENGCYKVEGVGTQEVTVTRLGSGPNCQGLSHIDAIVGEAPEGHDVCPNIEGSQSEVPEGLVIDNEGNCVHPPDLDVCPNIDGTQSHIPEGMVKDEHGNCVAPTSPPPPPPAPTPPAVLGTTTQVQAPTGGVKAGFGGGSNSAQILVPGLVSSIAVLGYGVLRLRAFE